MASINDIVKVNVVNSAKSISQIGFGTLLFVTDEVPIAFKDVLKIYDNVDALLKDGFTQNHKSYLAAKCYFSQSPRPSKILIVQKGEEDWVTTLSKISEQNDDWYVLATFTREEKDILEISDYIESQQKIYVFSSCDEQILNTPFNKSDEGSDIFSQLKLKELSRTATLFSRKSDEFPECGWFGGGIASPPGTTTYCYKNITTIPSDSLSSTQFENIQSKNGNTYEFLAGQNITRYGCVSNGNYIDIMMSLDFISSRIKEVIYALLVNSPKIPFTEAGIVSIQNQIHSVLNHAMDLKILSQYGVKMPKAADISQANKSKRVLEDIAINLSLSGAIQLVSAQIIYEL